VEIVNHSSGHVQRPGADREDGADAAPYCRRQAGRGAANDAVRGFSKFEQKVPGTVLLPGRHAKGADASKVARNHSPLFFATKPQAHRPMRPAMAIRKDRQRGPCESAGAYAKRGRNWHPTDTMIPPRR